MEIGIHSVVVWVVSVFTASFSLVIFLGGKSISSKAFAHGVFWFSMWSVAMGIFIASTSKELGVFFGTLTYFCGSVIAAAFFIFFYTFPHNRKVPKKIIIALCVIEVVFLFLYFWTDLMVGDFNFTKTLGFWVWKVRPLSILFDAYFFSVFGFGIYRMYLNYKNEVNPDMKRSLRYMLFTFIIGIIPPSLFDIVLLWFGVFNFNWLGPVTGLIWVTIVGYSMLKYQQMSVRLVFSEVFIVAMLVIFFTNVFIDIKLGMLGKTLLPVLFCVFGYLVIKSVLREVEQGEKLGELNKQLFDLNQNLEQKVADQTVAIRNAYEIEKKAHSDLQSLDQNKNDFIIVTQHHLRTPLAQIRWYCDSVLSGLYGPVPDDVAKAVFSVSRVSEKLTRILNHFLDISQLKIGKKILNVESVGIFHVVQSVIDEQSSEISRKKITVTLIGDDMTWPRVLCDSERIKDVFSIILDNAVKYNVQGGVVHIEAKAKKRNLYIEVTNTGILLTQEDCSRIFRESFFRSKEAKIANPLGMGVGLLVVKTIMMAHKGSVVIQSGKGNLGAVVTVQIPLDMSA